MGGIEWFLGPENEDIPQFAVSLFDFLQFLHETYKKFSRLFTSALPLRKQQNQENQKIILLKKNMKSNCF